MQVCTSLQTDKHASTTPLSFLQAGCPSCCPTNSVKALCIAKTACIIFDPLSGLPLQGVSALHACCVGGHLLL